MLMILHSVIEFHKIDLFMNSILFAKTIKEAAFITISVLTAEHSWYLLLSLGKISFLWLLGQRQEK